MTIRKQLGDFSSIVCFKALVVGVEETLGVQAAGVALKAAGRKRGKALATSLGFDKGGLSVDEAAVALKQALGADGTRLCNVDKIEDTGETYKVYLSDTVCSAGEPDGSKRELSFTFGAVHGAMETLVGKKLRGKQVGSVLTGAGHDIIEFTVV